MIRGALDWCSTGFSLAVATSESPCPFWFFFLFERSEGPSSASLSHFALPLERSKIAPTTSLLEAWLVMMSMSSLVVRGPLRPNLWTRFS